MNRTPIVEEERWQFYRPRDKGNRDMGPSPVTQVVLWGIEVPEGHHLREVDTVKGKVPTAPRFIDRSLKGWLRPAPWAYDVDWTAINRGFGNE